MKYLNSFCFYGYVAALLLVGGSGIFIAEWELTTIFHLDLEALDAEARATLLNQYRFLKSLELGFGLFCIVFRKKIFTDRVLNHLFLIILFLGVGARTLSIMLDGLPQWAYVGFTVFEGITGMIVLLYSRQTLPARP